MAPRSGDKTTLQVSPLDRPQPKPQHDLIQVLPQMQLMKPRISDHSGSTCLHGNTAGSCLRPGDHNGLRNDPTRAYNGGWKASPACTTQVGNISTSNNLQSEGGQGQDLVQTTGHQQVHNTSISREQQEETGVGELKSSPTGEPFRAPAYISQLQTSAPQGLLTSKNRQPEGLTGRAVRRVDDPNSGRVIGSLRNSHTVKQACYS